MKVMAIVGSPRPTGNTNYLVDQALEEIAGHGLETEKIILSEYKVNPCQGHQNCSSFPKCRQDDDAPWILDKFSRAEGIILGSPVYYYNMTAQMKAFVDRNYFLYRHGIALSALCAGLIVVAGGAGMDQTARALRRFVKLATNLPDEKIEILIGLASGPGDIKSNQPAVEEARKLGRRMAEILAP
jgi:multimeric flavodoxin WrbA